MSKLERIAAQRPRKDGHSGAAKRQIASATCGREVTVFLLDTNVVSELRRARPHGAVLAWIRGVDDADLSISAVTLGELQAGVEVTREQDEAKAQELHDWVDLVAASYNVLPMDGAAFRIWATLIHRKSDTLNEDAMIAAIARVHRLTVVTRNTGDFRSFGVPLLNPFKAT